MKRNKLVIFEGGDICGKTTQVKLFIDTIIAEQKYNIIKIKFPNDLCFNLLEFDRKTETSKSFSEMNENVFIRELQKDNNLYNELKRLYFESKNKTDPNEIERDIYKIQYIFNKIYKSVSENIELNSNNKSDFIDIMSLLISGDIDDFKTTIEYTDKYPRLSNFFENIKYLERTDKLKLKELLEIIPVGKEYLKSTYDKFIACMESEKPILFVFDRFVLSGLVYNVFAPAMYIYDNLVDVFNDIYKTFEFSENYNLREIACDNNYDPHIGVIIEFMNIHNYLFNNKYIMDFGGRYQCSYNGIVKEYNYYENENLKELHSIIRNITQVIFKPSNIFRDNIIKYRARDNMTEYDINDKLMDCVYTAYDMILSFYNDSVEDVITEFDGTNYPLFYPDIRNTLSNYIKSKNITIDLETKPGVIRNEESIRKYIYENFNRVSKPKIIIINKKY